MLVFSAPSLALLCLQTGGGFAVFFLFFLPSPFLHADNVALALFKTKSFSWRFLRILSLEKRLNSSEELQLFSWGGGEGKAPWGQPGFSTPWIPNLCLLEILGVFPGLRWGKQGKQEAQGGEFLLLSPRPCERGPCAGLGVSRTENNPP